MTYQELPAGRSKWLPTLSPGVQGWGLSGESCCGVIDESPNHAFISSSTTRLDCEPGAFAYHARGAYWQVSDITWLGHADSETGILVSQKGGAFNGAFGRIERCTFSVFDSAIRIGETRDDHGNDNHHFTDCGFAHCGAALTVGARQAMHLRLTGWNTRWVNDVVRVEAGGKLTLDGLDTECSGTILHLVGDGQQLGPNNAIYVVRGVTVDAGAGGKVLTLVDQEQPHWLRATFEDVWMPSGPYELRARVQGPDSLLRINRLENAQATMRIRLEGGARCIIKDSVLPASAAVILDDASQGELKLVDCIVNGKWVSTQTAQGK